MSRYDEEREGRVLPPGMDEPVFAEPWQAEAFALTVALHDKGLFSWGEWAQTLSAEVKAPGAAQDGSDYYDRWLRALKSCACQGPCPAQGCRRPRRRLAAAAHATPHGKPILLENDPQRGA